MSEHPGIALKKLLTDGDVEWHDLQAGPNKAEATVKLDGFEFVHTMVPYDPKTELWRKPAMPK
jgi:hypothetical protein